MITINGASAVDWLGSCPSGHGVPVSVCHCGSPIRRDGAGCTGPTTHPLRKRQLLMYASRTMTRRNLCEIAARGWRLLASPGQLSRTTTLPPLSYALDNGAWTAHTQGSEFDGAAYRKALDLWAHGADWIALPDVVMGGVRSLRLSLSWVREVRRYHRPMLFVVQDGMRPDREGRIIEDLGLRGAFVGGSTEWKESSLPEWGAWAHEAGAHLHVGRVNSIRRIRLCLSAGAHSADGTSVTRFASTAAKLDTAALGAQVELLAPNGAA